MLKLPIVDENFFFLHLLNVENRYSKIFKYLLIRKSYRHRGIAVIVQVKQRSARSIFRWATASNSAYIEACSLKNYLDNLTYE